MNIWLPNPLYQAFPLLCILIGFFVAAVMCNPFGIIIAIYLYIYSFSILWLRSPAENGEGG